MNFEKLILRSAFASVAISIGGTAYLYCLPQSKHLASLAFSIGLIIVILAGALLYTGIIGLYPNYRSSIKFPLVCRLEITAVKFNIIAILAINLIVIFSIGAVIQYIDPDLSAIAADIVSNKCGNSWIKTLLSSTGCGILMSTAVYGYKNLRSILIIIIPVYIFVICGFDHCIANMFYVGLAVQSINILSVVKLILLSIVGNTIGGLLCGYICTITTE